MSRPIAFMLLALLAGLFFGIGHLFEPHFLADLWSQLFMLTVGTLATTFVLDALLRRDTRHRQLMRDALAFRTFATNLLSQLLEISGARTASRELFEAALAGDKPFALVAAQIAETISQSSQLEPSAHARYYLNISSVLRDLSKQYIRLFSANQREMVTLFQELDGLANRWVYYNEFSHSAIAYRTKLRPDDPNKTEREADFQAQTDAARVIATETANKIADLATRSAQGRRSYV